MTFLPIVERELRVAARRPATYWLRLGVALVGFCVMGLLLSNSRRIGAPPTIGRNLFCALAIALFGFALFAGAFLTADTVTREKREGTLGLLFLTDLKPFDVISGKLVAASLNALLGFLATVPLLMFPVLLGGTTFAQVSWTVVTVAFAMGVSLTIGVLLSTICRSHRLAVLCTLTTIAVLTGLPYVALATECGLRGGTARTVSDFLWISPAMPFVSALSGGRLVSVRHPASALGLLLQVALILAATGTACWRLPRLIQDDAPLDSTQRRQTNRPRRGGTTHPFWLAARDSATRRFMLGITMALGVICLTLVVLSTTQRQPQAFLSVAMIIAFFMHLLLKCLFAAEVTDRFSQDQTTGVLEIILSTPCNPQTIFSGHWDAVRRRLGGSRILLTAVNAVIVLGLSVYASKRNSHDEESWMICVILTGILFLYLDCQAMFWAGLGCALKTRTAGRAFLTTVGRVLLPGWIGVFFFFLAGFSGLLNSQDATKSALVLWMVGFLIWDLALIATRRANLRAHFRELVAEHM